MKYFIFGLILLVTIVSIKASESKSQNDPCKHGETTSFDGCNSCVCSNGVWACTLKLCLPEEGFRTKREVQPECTPPEHKLLDSCNKCFCTEKQIWACTKMACP